MGYLAFYVIGGLVWVLTTYSVILRFARLPVEKLTEEISHVLETTARVIDMTGLAWYLIVSFFIWPITAVAFFIAFVKRLFK